MYQEMRLLWRLGMLLIALFSFGTTMDGTGQRAPLSI